MQIHQQVIKTYKFLDKWIFIRNFAQLKRINNIKFRNL